MSDFWSCTVAEIKALGMWCVIHGPEIWIAVIAVCILSVVLVLGMWLAALLSANGRDEDENKRDL